MKEALVAGASPTRTLAGGATPLGIAVANGHYEIAEILIERGADPKDRVGPFSMTLLELVVGRFTSFNDMQEQMGNPHVTANIYDDQPLVLPREREALRIASLLLARGVEVDANDTKGRTALGLAAYMCGNAIATALLDAGADPNATDAEGNTPLHTAALSPFDCERVTDTLLRRGANPSRENRKGQTPGRIAAAAHHNSAAARLQR